MIGIHVNFLAVRREPDRIKIQLPNSKFFSTSSTIGSRRMPHMVRFKARVRKR